MWTSVAPVSVEEPAPSARSKHSATLLGENVYLLGGRNGNLPIKDFWKYHIISGKWQVLRPKGEKLPLLQEHSAVVYKERIYVFGGEVGFSAGTETPLWCYDVKENSWRKIKSKKGVASPKGRRGHTALVHRGTMLIYGGYQDLRGSCSELWAFHFGKVELVYHLMQNKCLSKTETWHLLSTLSSKNNSNLEIFPPPRHKHSAIIHDDCMWVYGGMTDLQERGDLWKWDTVSKKWYLIKTKINPGPLHSHAVCKLPSAMLLFGGERGGHPTNELWKFQFSTEMWEKLVISGPKPQPRSESVAFSISELSLMESPNSPDNKTARLRSRTCISAERNRHSSYLPNNRVAPCEKTYVFQPSQTNYTDGSDQLEEKTTRNFLHEISRISRLNKCSYTVLTGCTTDSTESLLKQHSNTPNLEEIDTEVATPTKMVKSKSAYVIKKKNNEEEKKEEENKITREPISVPNFSLLTLPTPVLTPVEATKLVYLDTDEENEFLGTVQVKNATLNVYENFSPPKRGESYSSHLGYADNPLYQHMMKLNEKENVSSTSDYASIETVNRLSSTSNYSVKTNAQDENVKNKEKDGPFGFSNPNYLGPLEKKHITKVLADQDSLVISSDEDFLEMQDYNGTFTKNTRVFFKNSTRCYPSDCPNLGNKGVSKRRAHSAGRAERFDKVEKETEFDKIGDYVPLYVYVFGGKEHGQVTIFQRPISVWKLKLF